MRANGHFFRTRSAQFLEAQAVLSDTGKSIRFEDRRGELLADIPVRQIQSSARLGTLTRKLYLPDGGCFETRDNDAVDFMLRASRRNPTAGFLHRLEMSWHMVAISVAVAIGVVVFMAFIGIPALSLQLAQNTPPSITRIVSDQTMIAFDKLGALKPTKLKKERVASLEAHMAHIAKFMPPAPGGYRLLLRNAPALGPNAFALPDGRIVMTDQIVALAKSDEELEAVLGHEISHIVHAHGLQRVYQASLVPVIVAFISGDVSQAAQTAAILPGLLLQSSYSQSFEQQADDDAAAALKQAGIKPSRLSDLLVRIEQKYCGKKGCGPNWLGSHPETSARAERLRGN